MKITNTIILTLGAAALSLAAPHPLSNPSAPPSDIDPAVPNDHHGGPDAVDPAPPHPDPRPELARRLGGGPARVRYCQHANGGGACRNHDFAEWRCANVDPWWNDRVSSIYANPGWKCYLFANRGCGGRSVEFKTPGILDLKSKGLNDQGSSFKCVAYVAAVGSGGGF